MEDQAVDAGIQTVSYARIVELIRAGDAAGAEALYHSFARGFRFLLARSIPIQDLEDKLHDTFIALVQALRNGSLRNPAALPAFAQTILRRQIVNTYRSRKIRAELDSMALDIADRSLGSLDSILHQEQTQELECALRGLSADECEIITRFYISEEPAKQIQDSMQLNEARFYFLKNRGRKKLIAALSSRAQRLRIAQRRG